ncbi:hypothetical protein [Negadavirga shengliensis]|uniref:Uncharacterized protein n=1 Tax=Negadavirga shengliensis TaxID=1389218 RepID=A0ABV9SWD0_9BACT
MEEVIIYGILFLALLAHLVFAARMYRIVHRDTELSFHQKNDWKLKALIFPAYYWIRYKNTKK